jgi:hypothetical protein
MSGRKRAADSQGPHVTAPRVYKQYAADPRCLRMIGCNVNCWHSSVVPLAAVAMQSITPVVGVMILRMRSRVP